MNAFHWQSDCMIYAKYSKPLLCPLYPLPHPVHCLPYSCLFCRLSQSAYRFAQPTRHTASPRACQCPKDPFALYAKVYLYVCVCVCVFYMCVCVFFFACVCALNFHTGTALRHFSSSLMFLMLRGGCACYTLQIKSITG